MNNNVSLFITCILDFFYPDTGEAVVELLEKQGLTVEFREAQTCCGRFALEAGDTDSALSLERQFLDVFEGAETILVPSAQCAAMIKREYPRILKNDARAVKIADRTWEFSEFMVSHFPATNFNAQFSGKIAYHPACHLVHDLQATSQAPVLLAGVQGATLVPLASADECCGFGGPFSVTQPEISGAILQTHVNRIEESGADIVVTCDAGCLLQLNGGLGKRGCGAKAVHLADVLANHVEPPPPPPSKKSTEKPLRPRPW